jgi:hypothetical protein
MASSRGLGIQQQDLVRARPRAPGSRAPRPARATAQPAAAAHRPPLTALRPHLSPQDASRLVFVSVKDARPKRKVAVPIPEGATFPAFLAQVAAKLKLAGVGALALAATGERVTRLDQLHDIDELYVTESAAAAAAAGPSSGGGAGGNGYGGGLTTSPGRLRAADSEISAELSAAMDAETAAGAKYTRRQSALGRAARRAFPALFPGPGLPVTARDAALSPVDAVRRRARRRRRAWTDPRCVLALFALLSLAATGGFFWMWQERAGAGAGATAGAAA